MTRRQIDLAYGCAAFVLMALLLVGCGAKLPPIQITIPVGGPTPLPANTTPDTTPAEPTPVVAPEPEPEPPAALFEIQNLNIWVLDAAAAPVPNGYCVVGDERRRADGGGFINFAIAGSVPVMCSAPGYFLRDVRLPPGDHRVHLERIPDPTPAKPELPAPTIGDVCGAAANRNGVSHACLERVALTSPHYGTCNVTGSVEACHYYVREVVRALNTTTGNPRWGLLKKTKGGDNVEGYGTDVIAFLPERFPLDAVTWQWLGVDVIGGIGAPGARFLGGDFNPVVSCDDPARDPDKWCNRTGDIWAPVPK